MQTPGLHCRYFYPIVVYSVSRRTRLTSEPEKPEELSIFEQLPVNTVLLFRILSHVISKEFELSETYVAPQLDKYWYVVLQTSS